MEGIIQKHMASSGTEGDLKQQFTIYEVNSQCTSYAPYGVFQLFSDIHTTVQKNFKEKIFFIHQGDIKMIKSD